MYFVFFLFTSGPLYVNKFSRAHCIFRPRLITVLSSTVLPIISIFSLPFTNKSLDVLQSFVYEGEQRSLGVGTEQYWIHKYHSQSTFFPYTFHGKIIECDFLTTLWSSEIPRKPNCENKMTHLLNWVSKLYYHIFVMTWSRDSISTRKLLQLYYDSPSNPELR